VKRSKLLDFLRKPKPWFSKMRHSTIKLLTIKSFL
jgi:hypothetical protein